MILTDLLCLQIAQMAKFPDLAILVLTDRWTELIALPLAHACGIIIME